MLRYLGVRPCGLCVLALPLLLLCLPLTSQVSPAQTHTHTHSGHMQHVTVSNRTFAAGWACPGRCCAMQRNAAAFGLCALSCRRCHWPRSNETMQ